MRSATLRCSIFSPVHWRSRQTSSRDGLVLAYNVVHVCCSAAWSQTSYNSTAERRTHNAQVTNAEGTGNQSCRWRHGSHYWNASQVSWVCAWAGRRCIRRSCIFGKAILELAFPHYQLFMNRSDAAHCSQVATQLVMKNSLGDFPSVALDVCVMLQSGVAPKASVVTFIQYLLQTSLHLKQAYFPGFDVLLMDFGYNAFRFVIAAALLAAPISLANWLIANFWTLFSSFLPSPNKWSTLYIQISGQKPRAPASMQSFAKVFTPGLPPFVSWIASKKKEEFLGEC